MTHRPFWGPPVARLAGIAVASAILGLIAGAAWGFGLAALLLLALVLTNLRYQYLLHCWLGDPDGLDLPNGRLAWTGIFADMYRVHRTERKSRALLAATLERFRQASQALPYGVVLLDPADHIEWCNRAAEQHFALDAQRDHGLLLTQLVRQPEFGDYLERTDESGPRKPLVLRSGTQRETVLSVVVIRFDEDAGRMIVSRDITEISRAETIRRDFIANVSHELRTPLTVISGFLEHFAADPGPDAETGRHFHQLMQDQARRMIRLVDDLLTLSRLENDPQPPREDPVNVPAMLKALLDEGRALSGGRHRIELELAAGSLRGSAEELRSAFSNLVSNAIRYTPEGGSITLRWAVAAGRPTFSVNDTGIGIPAEHIPRLTERFYRVDKGRSTATGGTGLGLAIVKHVLARHQAALRIQSMIGEGSTFSAVFPADRLL